MIEVGKCYLRRAGSTISVRKVVRIDGEDVEYEVLFGPQRRRQSEGRTRLKNFARWASCEVEEMADYAPLVGCRRFATFTVQNTRGEPILRCNEHKARFYLRKGHAVEVAPGVLRFTNDVTEKRLEELYEGTFSEFFLAVKNDRCVACGAETNLTRHHVVPQRVKPLVPQPHRSCLSNVLFVCIDCHKRYERAPEPGLEMGEDPLAFCRAWRDHFIDVLQPRFLPAGWDIVSVKNLEKAGASGG